jgi:cardiolipin synthase A/B
MRSKVRLLEDGGAFFDRLFVCIEGARRSIAMRCFTWRDDETGEMLARALINAADRGVRVTVLKDLVGATYEYSEGSRQSFLHKTIGWRTRLEALALMLAYTRMRWPGPVASPLARSFLSHPGIFVQADRRRFDHSKVYVVDDEVMFVGGVGVGDEERLSNLDFMVEIDGADHVARYNERNLGAAPFDPARRLDFMLHSRNVHGERAACPLLQQRLALIESARSRVTIEMAYLGDSRVTRALVESVGRGVAVTLVTGVRANVIPDLNLASCDDLLRKTGAPPHLRVVAHPRPVHSKAMVIDGTILDLGSTNFTVLSHGGYEEVDVYVRDSGIAAEVEAIIERHASEGVRLTGRVPFNRARAAAEGMLARRQARTNTS